MITGPAPMCWECKHFNWERGGVLSCKAFPRIPNPILMNEHDHRKAFRGDKGIRFEPVEPDNIGQSGSPLLEQDTAE